MKTNTLSVKLKYPDVEINPITAYIDYLGKKQLIKKAEKANIIFHIPTLLKFKPDLNINSFLDLLNTFFDYIKFRLSEIEKIN